MNDSATDERPGEAAIEQILADIEALDHGKAGLLYMMQATLEVTEPKIMAKMAPARRRAAAARVAGGSWTSEALTQVHEAARRRVAEVYPDWPDAVEQAPVLRNVADAPSCVAETAVGAAFVAVEGNSLSGEEVTMLTQLWNGFVAKEHPVRPPTKQRTGLLARIFGTG